MAKNDRLYRLSSRHLWKKLQCIECGKHFKEGDPVFSKQSSGRTRYYCGKCAERVNLITEKQLETVIQI